MASPKDFFTQAEQEAIVQTIVQAEAKTTGEIRLHLENKSGKDPMKRAIEVFNHLNMHETAHGTGVLFYMALNDHAFTILGDDAIHAKVGSGFWDAIKETMQEHFRAGKFAEGLCLGIERAGEALSTYFPKTTGNPNELSDDISFGA